MSWIFDLLSHEGVALTLGLTTAAGMFVGAALAMMGFGRKQLFGWVLGLIVLFAFTEAVRLEIFLAHNEAYTILPLLVILVPATVYTVGVIVGIWIVRRNCVDTVEELNRMLSELADANGK